MRNGEVGPQTTTGESSSYNRACLIVVHEARARKPLCMRGVLGRRVHPELITAV